MDYLEEFICQFQEHGDGTFLEVEIQDVVLALCLVLGSSRFDGVARRVEVLGGRWTPLLLLRLLV